MVDGLDELRAGLIEARGRGEKPARMRRLFFAPYLLAAVLLTGLSAACGQARDEQSQSATDSVPEAGPADSVLPVAAALTRFRAGLPPVTRLDSGAATRDELVQDFIRAVERNDTAAVSRMHVSRAEYAYLYFPTSIYMRKPYLQPPEIAWLLSSQSSEKGIARVLRRLGGRKLGFGGYRCGENGREGDNTFWRSCTVTYRDPTSRSVVTRRLFGAIIERDGRYKFLSYANDF